MKDIKSLLNEVKGENAHRQAVQMGLKYKGFGYWVNPNTGEVTHKTENDQLVEVEPDVASEKADKGAPEAAGAAPSGGMGNPEGLGGSFGTFMNKQLPTGMGTNVQGIADNGFAQAPNTDNGRWEPGPDGDTFAGDVEVSQTMADWNKPKKDAYVGKTNHYGWTAGKDGDNYTTMTMDQILKKAYSINIDDYESREVPTMSEGKSFTSAFKNDDEVGDYLKASGSYKKAHPTEMSPQDKDQIKMMNDRVSSFVKDPNFNMSLKGEMVGEGDYGKVYLSPDGNQVIKEGRIGKNEAQVMNELKDNPNFPSLINAQFKSPFKQSPKESDDLADEINSGLANEYAEGTFAMDRMPGVPLHDAVYGMSRGQKQDLIRKVFKARALMHLKGISHNDMHGGNIFYDKDSDKVSILDLGRAQSNPISALLEAFGAAREMKDRKNPLGDSQLAYDLQDDGILQEFAERRSEILDDPEFDFGDSGTLGDRLRSGGINNNERMLDAMAQYIPAIDSPEKIKDILRRYYNEYLDDDDEDETPVLDAFAKAKEDEKLNAVHNIFRSHRGNDEQSSSTPVLDKLKLTDQDN